MLLMPLLLITGRRGTNAVTINGKTAMAVRGTAMELISAAVAARN